MAKKKNTFVDVECYNIMYLLFLNVPNVCKQGWASTEDRNEPTSYISSLYITIHIASSASKFEYLNKP